MASAVSATDARVRASKSLSWLLRHNAEKCGLSLGPDGFARVADVLSIPAIARAGLKSEQFVREVRRAFP
jgi:RNA:NAD 2'-phosphotransferase (TPT1/KptA family)